MIIATAFAVGVILIIIIVIVVTGGIAGVPNPIPISIFLVRIGNVGTVVNGIIQLARNNSTQAGNSNSHCVGTFMTAVVSAG